MSQNDLIEAAKELCLQISLASNISPGSAVGRAYAEVVKLLYAVPPAPAGLEEVLPCFKGAYGVQCPVLTSGGISEHSPMCPAFHLPAVQALMDAREAELRAEIERLRGALLLTYSIRACDLPDDSEPWVSCAQTIDAARAALEEK